MKNELFFSSILLISGGLIAMDQAENSQHAFDFSQLNKRQQVNSIKQDFRLCDINTPEGEEMDPSQEELSIPSSDSDDDIPACPARSNKDIHELLGSLSIAPEDEEPARSRVRDRSPSLDRDRSCSPASFERILQEEVEDVQKGSQEGVRKNLYLLKLSVFYDILKDLKDSHITPKTKRHILIHLHNKAEHCAGKVQNFPSLYRRFNCIMHDADRQLNSLNER